MSIDTLEPNRIASFDRADLYGACYRQAGMLVMRECADYIGWFLVWKTPTPKPGGIAWPSISSRHRTSDVWMAIVSMGGVAAELFQKGRWLDADDLVTETELLGAFGDDEVLSNAARAISSDFSHYAIDQVTENWSRIERYARQAIDQWNTPCKLESFRIDLMFDDQERKTAPPHFASAIRPGQITKAALVQSTLSTIDQYRV